MNKQEVINALENFKDEYGTSFEYAEPQAMSVIEDALDLYFGIIDKINSIGLQNVISKADVEELMKAGVIPNEQ